MQTVQIFVWYTYLLFVQALAPYYVFPTSRNWQNEVLHVEAFINTLVNTDIVNTTIDLNFFFLILLRLFFLLIAIVN